MNSFLLVVSIPIVFHAGDLVYQMPKNLSRSAMPVESLIILGIPRIMSQTLQSIKEAFKLLNKKPVEFAEWNPLRVLRRQ
jgi:hypothetical protein